MFQTFPIALVSALLGFALTAKFGFPSEALLKPANNEGRLVIYGTTQLEHMCGPVKETPVYPELL